MEMYALSDCHENLPVTQGPSATCVGPTRAYRFERSNNFTPYASSKEFQCLHGHGIDL